MSKECEKCICNTCFCKEECCKICEGTILGCEEYSQTDIYNPEYLKESKFDTTK